MGLVSVWTMAREMAQVTVRATALGSARARDFQSESSWVAVWEVAWDVGSAAS